MRLSHFSLVVSPSKENKIPAAVLCCVFFRFSNYCLGEASA